jgi:hypothetical protein
MKMMTTTSAGAIEQQHRRRRRRRQSTWVVLTVVALCTFYIDSLLLLRYHAGDEHLPPQTGPVIIRGHLYSCGHNLGGNRVFPDYTPIQEQWDPNIHTNTTQYDILVYGMHGRCVGQSNGVSNNNINDIVTKFNGKILYFNGEPVGDVFDDVSNPEAFLDRVYQIGPYPPQPERKNDDILATMRRTQSLQVYFLTMYTLVVHHNTTQWEWLIDPEKKRRSNQHEAIIYLTSNCSPFRQQAAENLSAVLPLEYGPGCRINTPNATLSAVATSRANFVQNYKVFSQYRYCLVMENSGRQGYMTEKIINAYLGGCLPIYYGSPADVYSVFSDQSLIYYDVDDPQPALSLLRQLASNQTLYEERMSTPILRDGLNTINKHFSLYPYIGDGSLNKQIRQMMKLPQFLA